MAKKIKAKKTKPAATEPTLIKLNFGCGKVQIDGFEGVDVIDFGQKWVVDVRRPWPWGNGTVSGAVSSHFLEHLTNPERIHFFNELYRVMIPGAQATMTVPYLKNTCAYGDPTHQWPPFSEWFVMYLNKEWRNANAPHVPMTCDFDTQYGWTLDQAAVGRNVEYQQMGIQNYWNVGRDFQFTVTRRE